MPPPLLKRKTKFENGVYYERTGTPYGNAPSGRPLGSRCVNNVLTARELTGISVFIVLRRE